MIGSALRVRVLALTLLTASLATGCQATESTTQAASPTPAAPSQPPSRPPLSISNQTSIPVTLVVNGSVVETVAPGNQQDPIAAALPPRPWTIET